MEGERRGEPKLESKAITFFQLNCLLKARGYHNILRRIRTKGTFSKSPVSGRKEVLCYLMDPISKTQRSDIYNKLTSN